MVIGALPHSALVGVRISKTHAAQRRKTHINSSIPLPNYSTTTTMSNAYYELEDRIADALIDVAEQTFSSIARTAYYYGVEPRTLQKRVKGGSSKSTRPATNTRLTRAEKSSLCEYIDLLDN